MNKNSINSSTKIVFVSTLFIGMITSISVIFPALILSIVEEIPRYPQEIDIFEKGVLFHPFLIINITVIFLAILYSKNKIPQNNIIKKIIQYDVSRKQALVIVLIILDFYMMLTLQEIWMSDPWEDYNRTVVPRLQIFTIEEIFNPNTNTVSTLLGKISMILFENYRVMPLIFSTVLLFLTYYFTILITKKQISGIISMLIVLSSTVFLTYDTTITYPNFWIVFYLLSLILIHKFWPLSPILFGIAIISKPLPILFLPMTFFFIYTSKISKKKKIFVLTSYVVLITGIILKGLTNKGTEFILVYNNHEFWSGFTTIASQFRFEPFIILFLIPVIIGLFITSKNSGKKSMLMMFLIAWMLLLAPIISGFTTYTNNTQRFIPLIIFFSIAIGVLLSTQTTDRRTVHRMDAVSPG